MGLCPMVPLNTCFVQPVFSDTSKIFPFSSSEGDNFLFFFNKDLGRGFF